LGVEARGADMPKMDRKQVRLDKRQQKWLKRAAKARDVSQAEIIREAIDRYILAEEAAAKQPDEKRKAKRRPAPERPAKHGVAERLPRAPKRNKPSKWHSDDPFEERLRQIEQLTQ
jgi:hypothetical protein